MTTVFILTLALCIGSSAHGQSSTFGPTGFSGQIITATPSFHVTDESSLTIRDIESDTPQLTVHNNITTSTQDVSSHVTNIPESTTAKGSGSVKSSSHPSSSASEMTPSTHLSSHSIISSHGSIIAITSSLTVLSPFASTSHATNHSQSASITLLPSPSSEIPQPSPTHSASNTSASVSHNVTAIVPSTTSIIPSATSAVMPSSSTISPTPTPIVKYECGPECKSLKHRMMAAIGFAVVLGIICVVLAFLLWRQFRAQNSDGSSGFSRLI